MTVVVDSSVALKLLLAEEGSEQARRLFTNDADWVAPDLVIPEACNVLWRKTRKGDLTPDDAAALAAAIPGLFNELTRHEHLATRAVALAIELDRPAYDCFYLALRELLAVALITADRRLLDRIAGTSQEMFVTDLMTV